jgi:hypothetical protein
MGPDAETMARGYRRVGTKNRQKLPFPGVKATYKAGVLETSRLSGRWGQAAPDLNGFSHILVQSYAPLSRGIFLGAFAAG